MPREDLSWRTSAARLQRSVDVTVLAELIRYEPGVDGHRVGAPLASTVNTSGYPHSFSPLRPHPWAPWSDEMGLWVVVAPSVCETPP